jgi:hypothetical protein
MVNKGVGKGSTIIADFSNNEYFITVKKSRRGLPISESFVGDVTVK